MSLFDFSHFFLEISFYFAFIVTFYKVGVIYNVFIIIIIRLCFVLCSKQIQFVAC